MKFVHTTGLLFYPLSLYHFWNNHSNVFFTHHFIQALSGQIEHDHSSLEAVPELGQGRELQGRNEWLAPTLAPFLDVLLELDPAANWKEVSVAMAN